MVARFPDCGRVLVVFAVVGAILMLSGNDVGSTVVFASGAVWLGYVVWWLFALAIVVLLVSGFFFL